MALLLKLAIAVCLVMIFFAAPLGVLIVWLAAHLRKGKKNV